MTTHLLQSHLIQSTLFGIAIALLALLFRHNSARVRHRLWMAASVKFLIPFSLFTALGSHLSLPANPVPATVLMKFSQPRVKPAPPQIVPHAIPITPVDRRFPFQEIALGLWLAGFAAVSISRLARWRRVAVEIRRATLLQSGREFDAVARVRQAMEFKFPVDLRLTAGSLEPGTFGILRPVLSLPRGISDCLSERQLEAIAAHELNHIRRHDNLTAAIHMAIESLLWFHPLVWWIGSRLIEERERACDEEVLELGGDPETYASGILNVCRFYVQSPLACVAGVTGANLTKRIERIMMHRAAANVNFAKKLLLASVAVLAIGGPILIAQPPTQHLSFETASVRPTKSTDFREGGIKFLPGGRFVAKNASPIMLVAIAYDLPFQSPRLTGAPGLKPPDESYDIEATADKTTLPPDLPVKARNARMRLMLQSLLEDRFKLKIRHEPKEQPVYALVIGKGGPKLQKSKLEEKDCGAGGLEMFNPDTCHGVGGGQGRGIHGVAVSIADVALYVQNWTDKPLVDKTGLTGLFNIQTEGWTPMRIRPPNPDGSTPTGGDVGIYDPDRQTLYDVFQRLGLRMESQRATIDMVVVENIERPTEN